MTTATIAKSGIAEFRSNVDELLEKRQYFIERILPTLVPNRDYYIIKGKKSLGKAGAEKLASLYRLVATFEKDKDMVESLKIDGLVAIKCTLTSHGVVQGQGTGCAVLKNNNDDANKCCKMAEKSAFISSVIRATGLSDVFTSDLEDMKPESIQAPSDYFPSLSENTEVNEQPEIETESGSAELETTYRDPNGMTEKQRSFLLSLIAERITSKEQTEEWFKQLNSGLSKSDASELISSLIPMR